MNIDVSRTSHSLANTGIQQVTRQLYKSFNGRQGVVFDPFQRAWRILDSRERTLMNTRSLPANRNSKRSSSWSIKQRIGGYCRRFFQRKCFFDGGLLLPEVFLPKEWELSQLKNQFSGPIAAIFHDALPWRFPDWSSEESQRQHILYMHKLLKLDFVFAVSLASLKDLEAFWEEKNVPKEEWPQRAVLSLASSYGTSDSLVAETKAISGPAKVLMIATLEARKNHHALLDACEQLWDRGLAFEMILIGAFNRRKGASILRRISEIRRKGYPLKWEGAVTQSRVDDAYSECDLVVVPSLYEGFGLPVVEALSVGKPVVCTSYGALSEVLDAEACLVLKDGSASSIAAGLEHVLGDVELYNSLLRAARRIKSRTWEDVGNEIVLMLTSYLNKSSDTTPFFGPVISSKSTSQCGPLEK